MGIVMNESGSINSTRPRSSSVVGHRRYAAAALAVAACAGMGAASALATPIVSITQHTNETTAYTVSSTDLINGLTPATGSSLGEWKGNESTNADPAVLTNGAYGVAGGVTGWENDTFTVSDASDLTPDPTVLIYNLNLGSAPNGYDITNINTYSSWRDGNRNQQHYTVSYATVAAPTTFMALQTVSSNISVGGPSNREMLLSITGLSNVAALKFDFSPLGGYNYTGFRELDAIGSATVPEPASLGVLALGGLGLLGRRRRMA